MKEKKSFHSYLLCRIISVVALYSKGFLTFHKRCTVSFIYMKKRRGDICKSSLSLDALKSILRFLFPFKS